MDMKCTAATRGIKAFAAAGPTRGLMWRPAILAASALAIVPAAAQVPGLGQDGLAASSSPFQVDPLGLGSAVPSSPSRADVRVGGFLDDSLAGLGPTPSSTDPRPAYQLQPSLTTRVLATDNYRLASRDTKGEVTTSLIPSLTGTADTARIQGRFNYTPSLNFYANGTQSTRLDHRFLGTGTVTLIPGSFFVDVRANGSLSPIAQGLNDVTTVTQPREGLSRNYSASVSPYYLQRFGTLATAIVGYSGQYSVRQSSTLRLNNTSGPIVAGSDDLLTHTGYAALRTGEEFGRLIAEARVRGTAFTGGSSVTNGAHRYLGLVETRYAFTRTLSGIAEVGYENQRFGGTRPFRVDGPVWGVGFKLEPGPNTTITVRYRRRDGYDSPTLDARVGLGPRLVFFGRYLDQVTTSLRQTSDLLNSVTLDELGNPVDSRTGAPTPELSGSGILSPQNGLYRSRRGSASLTQFFAVDSVTLQYSHDQRSPLSVAQGQVAFSQNSDSVTAIWQRPLSLATRLNASVGYSWNRSGTFGSRSETLNGRVGLTHQLSRQFFISLQYQFTQRSSSVAGSAGILAPTNATQNTAIASLTARF